MNSKPQIYIPIEIFYREINSRIIIALNACLSGYRVYIGSKSGIDQILNYKSKKNIKGGIYLYKSQIISSPEYFNKIQKVCDHFAVIDEELSPGVVNSKEVILNRTINESNISKFFVVGKKMKKEILKYKKNFKAPIIVSGWPKYDIYRKEYSNFYKNEVKKIKKKFGKFILFTSNYGAISKNGLKIHINSLRKSKKKGLNYKNEIQTMKNYYNDFQYMVSSFRKYKNNFKKINIVFRPHPSDYFHDDWQNNLKELPNTHVVYDNDIIPWIIASEGIIHRGCSTSIDAFFLKKNIFFFLPQRKLTLKEKNLTYKISKKIINFSEINDLLKISSKNKKKLRKKINEELYINPLHSSSKLIIKELKNMHVQKEAPYNLNDFNNFIRNIRGYIGFLGKKLNFKKDLYSITSKNKFPSIMTLSYFKDKANNLFKNKKFKIKKISYDLFEFDI